MNRNYCIIVNSCDEYEDTWHPFFELLKANWKGVEKRIVLNTESKTYVDRNLKIETYQLYKPKQKVAWSERLFETLKLIDSEYVLMMLDDFLIFDKVDVDKINKTLTWMEEDKSIAYFCFNELDGPNIKSNKYEGFEKRTKECNYLTQCQASMWRKTSLMNLLRRHESPWDFEMLGTKRARKVDYKYYSATPCSRKAIVYDYQNVGLVRGRWGYKTEEILDKYNIKIDYSIRGFYVEKKYEKPNGITLRRIISYIRYITNKTIKEIRSR